MDADPRPHLAVTLGAVPGAPRDALKQVAALGIPAVQLSATQAGLRPRELDRSARRDLLAMLRRVELAISGVDCWIPPEHFTQSQYVNRAVEAARAAIDLAADLGGAPLSLSLPLAPKGGGGSADDATSIVSSLAECAVSRDVLIADHGWRDDRCWPDEPIGLGVDPASLMSRGENPAAAVLALGPRLAAVRLTDLTLDGCRAPISETGRLDVLAYRVAIETSEYRRPVIIDTRQWSNPWRGIEQTLALW